MMTSPTELAELVSWAAELIGGDATPASRSDAAEPTPTRLNELLVGLELTPEERALFGLALAVELDEPLRRRVLDAQGRLLLGGLTVGFALALLFQDTARRIAAQRLLGPDGRLVQVGLLTLDAREPGRFLDRQLVVPRRIVAFVLGEDGLDESLRTVASLVTPTMSLDRVVLPEAQRRALLDVVTPSQGFARALDTHGFSEWMPFGRGTVLLVTGASGTGKSLLAEAVATQLERPLLRVDCAVLAASGTTDQVRALFHEAVIHGAVLLFDDAEPLLARPSAVGVLVLDLLESFEGIAMVTARRLEDLDPAMERRVVHHLALAVPPPALRELLWEAHLPPTAPLSDDIDLGALARAFEFPGGAIRRAVVVALNKALARAPTAPVITRALLEEAANAQLQVHLSALPLSEQGTLGLDRLVLPEREMEQVNEIVAAARSQATVLERWGFSRTIATGKGITVLFDGPPGTGKTLTAELLGHELRLPLHRVNVSEVVSKYIGETEKNLLAVFSRARAARALLLFDEADALFGSRTAETRSSTDRYANMEVNVLLQEIERYEGVVVLTTNLFGGLDEAVRRRIQFRVTFPLPDAPLRARIWRTLLPPEAPVAPDVDADALGERFAFAGGHIKNALLRAAYAACERGEPIGMAGLERAALRECESLGMAVRV